MKILKSYANVYETLRQPGQNLKHQETIFFIHFGFIVKHNNLNIEINFSSIKFYTWVLLTKLTMIRTYLTKNAIQFETKTKKIYTYNYMFHTTYLTYQQIFNYKITINTNNILT